MPVTIDDAVLRAAHLDEQGFMREIAVALFAQERLTLGQASKLAGIGQLQFQAILANRNITIHYGVDEYREDVETLRQMGLL